MTATTKTKLQSIYFDLEAYNKKLSKYAQNRAISTAIFRYKKDYTNTTYKTNTELPIAKAIEEYEKYLKWKFYDDDNKIQTKLASKA